MEPIKRFETPLGPVEIRGRDTGRPVQLVLTGAFADENQLELNQARFPELDVWRMHLPGNHAPELVDISIGAFGFAFSHALRAALGDRRMQVVGLSVGALVALALDQALVDQYVLVDPPFRPDLAWPLQALADVAPPGHEAFLWKIFGVSKAGHETRDYRGLLDRLRRPATVLLAGVPLEPRRELAEWPSLVDEESRARLEAHTLIRTVIVEGRGHHVLRSPERVFEILRRTMPASAPCPR